MALLKLQQSDGWVQVSLGAAQLQLRDTSKRIAVAHSATVPDVNTTEDCVLVSSGIEYSLGKDPCYIKAIYGGITAVSALDIS